MSQRRRGVVGEASEAARFIWRHPANRGRRARKILEALAFQVRGRVFGKPSIARIGERSRIVVHPGRGQAGLLYANPTEWPEITCWRATLRPGDLFIDVGANVGAYTLWALELGCEVVAIEPNGWSAEQLRANLALNGAVAEVREVALADQPGTLRMTRDLGVLNHLVLGEPEPDVPVVDVPVVTLDEILGDREAAGVKIDVEGAELLVLQGAARALEERRIRLLQLEWNPCSERTVGSDRSAVAALLADAGYGLYRPDDRGVLHGIDDLGPGPDVFAKPGA